MATPNMPASEWPELEADDLRRIGETLQELDEYAGEVGEGPLPGTD